MPVATLAGVGSVVADMGGPARRTPATIVDARRRLPRRWRHARSRAVIRRLSGRSHVMLKQRWNMNYGHWLVEGLPRLALIKEHHKIADLGFIVSGYHGRAMQDVYEDSLALFGIRRDQLVELGKSPLRSIG